MTRLNLMIFCETATTPRYWAAAITELVAQGIKVTYALTRSADPPEEIARLDCDFLTLDCSDSRQYPMATIRLRKALRARSIDILHASEPIQGAIGGLASLPPGPTTCIYHRHHASRVPTGGLSRIAALTARRTIAVSDAVAAHALTHDRFNRGRIEVVWNGLPEPRDVSSQETRELRDGMGIPAHEQIVISVGHLRPEKGHLTLVAAMDKVNESLQEPVHLVIVGDGPERQTLEQAAKRTGRSIHFVGFQSDVAPWYAAADLVAIPSHHESFGLTAVEAMAASLPVVASDTGGLPEVVDDGTTGRLVSAGDPTGVARGILELLTDGAATRYGDAGRARYETLFTTESMVHGWMRVYETCR